MSTPTRTDLAARAAELDAAARRLPIYDHAYDIAETIRKHRVVVVEGPTGSGKTTQLPRILLRAGVSGPGRIGVTQPRRIAAVSVAWRIAAEEGVEVGAEVGYSIRFDDCTSEHTLIKVMTDGILLQELRTDRDLSAYDVLIIDEAHERSLNIDFTLGLLREVLERRPELRVIVSSATLDPAMFQRFFEPLGDPVPLLKIEARTHPVEIVYRPLRELEVAEAAAKEVLRLHRSPGHGHVLVFLTGEGMIRDVEELLLRRHRGKDMLVLPLFGRLTRDQQERVFDEAPGKRKVVLATNVAETSITIPGVQYVVDCGMAKVPRVSTAASVTTLREEGISRASADQRAGRAGRTGPGEAVRLYSRRDYEHRPKFTDEEIIRLDLSEVVLRLVDLGIRHVEDFAFPTRPPRQKIRAALANLRALGAIDDARRLTDIGRRMVPFPLSPRLARMIVEAADKFPDVVDDVLVVGAFLSGRAPWLYPQGEESEARQGHAALAQPQGDAITAVHAFRAWTHARDREAWCRRHYVDAHAMGFIAKAHSQLIEIAEHHGIPVPESRGGQRSSVVRAVAAGFVDRFLRLEGRSYLGPGDMKIAIHPSSVLFGQRRRYVVAAELVVSKRPYARSVSALEPPWIAELAPELAKQWHIRRPRKATIDLSEVPQLLRLGGVELPVTIHKSEPRVDIPVDVVPALIGADLSGLPAGATAWKARIQTRHYRLAAGTPLGELLELLPHLELPGDDERLARDVPEGALLEADRNLHTLERYLDRLLLPALPGRGRRPGWLMLVANGGGAYWYEVASRFPEAVTTTCDALDDLADALQSGDPIQPRLTELRTRIGERRDAIDTLLSARRERRRERRR